jgi:hypothetical protein
VVSKKDLKSLLAWWKTHESQFPHVGFLAIQIFGILGCQIKIEFIFNIASVLTNLWHYQLGFDHFDALGMIFKNKLDDARTNYKLVEEGVTKFFCAENKLLDEHEKEL